MTSRRKGTKKTSKGSNDPGAAVAPETGRPAAFPIVGIGASAGGLAAFEDFFSGIPADTDPDMAFIVVQHLAPDHASILTDLIQRCTQMQVHEVEDGMIVQPNCAYIIPPGRDMAYFGGALQLLEPAAPRGQRMPIDFFFRSLAEDLRERAIGIVLSGTGSDGTLGLRAIKGNGGMVMVQDPASTEFDGMPRSALATGLVDYQLQPAEMPAHIIAYVAQAFGRPPRDATAPPPRSDNALSKIFILLRAQTGHDFSQYKPSTVHRRIERRMAIHQIETADEYVSYLRQSSDEVEALFRDMLIGVTGFFRDEESFKALEEKIIPELLAPASPNGVIRVWSAGSSTGEEAYSLAILLAEHQERLKQGLKVQIFATDIDSHAVATARAGVYPASISADISADRLARFFSLEPGGGAYRVNKRIRDVLVFSEQNLIKDPPFSKLDLITCRNLLIYMGSELQKRLIPLFHYALKPGGFLFLGTSETVGEFGDLFVAVDRTAKLYRRQDDHLGTARTRFLPPLTVGNGLSRQPARHAAVPAKPPLRELAEKALLLHATPAAALVDRNGDILYLHGRTGLYLEPTPGEAGVNNILRMAREGLRRELATALHNTAATGNVERIPHLRIKSNGDITTVNLTVRVVSAGPAGAGATGPAADSGPSLFLITLEQAADQPDDEGVAVAPPATASSTAGPADKGVHAHVLSLQRELQAKDEQVRTANEAVDATNEELRSSMEEMQSVNEELQSTNEELETSKEELQSVNEELSTVNAELQTKVVDLSRANNDINNLLAGTGIATVFVDLRLRILRFTPAATRIINLIPGDIGRPVDHIVSNLAGYDGLLADTQAVLDTLEPKEVEVRTKAGVWYMMRILPYRTIENVIEGAVVNFLNIANAKHLQEKLHQAHIRVTEAIVATVREPLVVLDTDLLIVSANSAFCDDFRIELDKSLGRPLYEVGDRRLDLPDLRNLLETILPRELAITDYTISHEIDGIGKRDLRLNARIIREFGQSAFILLAIGIRGDPSTEKGKS